MNHDHADLSDHPRNAEEERERIARHIERAERAAHTRDLRGLTSLQQIVRALLLEELARYRSDGRFPRNRDFAARTPYFVDADGTRCAVAHLLDVGGEATLVDRIARERNNALVADLADEPRLLAWLAAAGLTVEEAALIQPGYCSPLWTTVCGDGLEYQPPYAVPASGVLRAVVIEANLERPNARVDEIHGTAPGVAVGDVLPVGALAPYDTQSIVGMTLLLPVSPGDGGVVVPSGYGGRFPGVALASNGTYTPHVNGVAVPTLSRAQFERAVMSSTCRDLVRGYDPRVERIDLSARGVLLWCGTRVTNRCAFHVGCAPRAGVGDRSASNLARLATRRGVMTCGLDASAVRFEVSEVPRECWDTLRTMNPIERVNTEFKRRTKSMDHAGVDTHA